VLNVNYVNNNVPSANEVYYIPWPLSKSARPNEQNQARPINFLVLILY